MAEKTYSLGLDYGTNSVRALIVDCADGREVAAGVATYRSGEEGVLLDARDPNLARQNPGDYAAGFFEALAKAIEGTESSEKDFKPTQIVGIGVDATGSTPIPVDERGAPLSELPQFQNDLAAKAWLWKDHTSFAEAEEIGQKAREMGRPYLRKVGGTYSSEWFWSKVLHCARTAPSVFEAAHAWIEFQDYVPGFLTGDVLGVPRGVCAAGHKALFSHDWDGLPDAEFLAALDPRLADLRSRLNTDAFPASHTAGKLARSVAERAELRPGIPVAVGLLDAHAGAVGSGVRPGTLVKILGTSSCDITVGPVEGTPEIEGICGIVPGSVLPDWLGIEAGQSAVGDLFAWFVRNLAPPAFAGPDAHARLTEAAGRLRPGESGLLALDWNNGNRTVLVDPLLTGLLVGQTLHTTAPEVYRALLEASAFGGLAIIERITESGVAIDEVVTGGGIAEKNPVLMQINADVSNRPFRVSGSSQTCALGAAIFGAVVGGVYESTEAAVEAMAAPAEKTYKPNKDAVMTYRKLYELYKSLHDAFGLRTAQVELYGVMKHLIALRDEVRAN